MRTDLGAFSLSLSVKDLDRSRAFYEALGFRRLDGNAEEGWLVMKNGSTVIGLFHGMFEGNLLTFTPGWGSDGQEVDPFTDVREIQRHLRAQGVEISGEVDESSTGPASVTLVDPDGNQILIDQHR